jgi:hypothetical protein
MSKAKQNWFITREGNKYCIRRMVILEGKRKSERYPAKKYKQFKDNFKELEKFVCRLNAKDYEAIKAKELFKLKHAFIDTEFLIRYRDDYLKVNIASEKDAKTLFNYLYKYCLEFFVEKLNLKNPDDWIQKEHIWNKYLLNVADDLDEDKRILESGKVLSGKVLKQIVVEGNRFLKYLHKTRPSEIPPLKFDKFSTSVIKNHESKRKGEDEAFNSKYIDDERWGKLVKFLESENDDIRFFVYIAKEYGLRRNEVLSLKVEDVKKGNLHLKRQYLSSNKNGPLKNRKHRRIPHWFSTPEKLYSYIQKNKDKIVHPDTLSKKFAEACVKANINIKEHDLTYNFTFHDLRRTFITNAVRKKVAKEELRLAAGHSSLNVTYRYYVMDSRKMDNETFIPSKLKKVS